MKNSSRIKAGKRSGNPGYRTASPWRAKSQFRMPKQQKKKPAGLGGF
jgi:hypothetical protein